MPAFTAMCICCSKPQSLSYGQKTPENQGGNSGGEKPPVSDTKYSSTLYDTLKVMTFNILMSHASDTGVQRWSIRKPACMKMIKELKPDIVGLQECPQSQYNDFLAVLPDYEGRNIPENRKNFVTCIIYRKDIFKFSSVMYCSWKSLPSDAHDWYRAHNSYEEGCPKYGIDESVDHIFFRNLEPLKYKTVWEPYDNVRYLSDHYPVLFTTLISYQEEVGSQTSGNDLEGYENGEKADIW